jgi:prephenate dehydrogenase
MQLNVLTIVGVGLIGGSIGLAARRRGVARCVRGVGRQRGNLERARDLGVLDEVHLELGEAAPGSDLVVFCTPVDQIMGQVLDAAPRCTPGTLLTDAGSTKARIVRGIEGRLPAGVTFVGGHPLAGSEKRGADYADALLFEGRWTVLTPTEHTKSQAVERVAAFWQALGSRTRIMSPEEHDRALAVTSHLPHLLAAALAATLPPDLQSLTASGFRDVTRIAAGDPQLWTAIFTHNRAAVLDALAKLQVQLTDLRQTLEAENWPALHDLLAHAKEIRDALGS